MTNEEMLLEDFEKRCPWMYKKLDGYQNGIIEDSQR